MYKGCRRIGGIVLLAAIGLPLAGTTCPVASVGVMCSNQLDASAFGFTLTVPAEFACTNVVPNPALILQARYRSAATNTICSVVVGPSGDVTTSSGDGVSTEELSQTANSTGVVFRRFKVTAAVGTISAFSYLGTTTLPSGNVLGITLTGFTDNSVLQTTLSSVIESVRIVP